MRWGEDVRLALRSLVRSPVRSFLLLQGIAWGVGIAIVPAAVLEGSRDAATRQAAETGTGRVALSAEPGSRALTEDDAAAVAVGLEGYRPYRSAAWRSGAATATVAGGAVAKGHLLAIGPDGVRVRDQRVASGRDFRPEEPVPVTILEPALAADLFPDGDPLGRTVELTPESGPAVTAEVVGVLAPRSAVALRTDDFGLETGHFLEGRVTRALGSLGVVRPDDAWKRSERCALVPLDRWPRAHGAVDGILVRTHPSEAAMIVDPLRTRLIERGAAPVARANLLWPFLASKRMEDMLRLKDALVLACLGMGAIVIANTMLLTVLERTSEIAVRRTEGATRADVAAQLLVEAGVLGAAGALLGIPLGIALAHVRVAFVPYTTVGVSFPTRTVLLACGVAVAAAVLGGVLPARRAAALDPARALREA